MCGVGMNRDGLFGSGTDLVLGWGSGSIAVMMLHGALGGDVLAAWIPGGLLILLFSLPHLLGGAGTWPWLVSLSIVPAACGLPLLWFPDTPKYLYARKRRLSALDAIHFYHGAGENPRRVVRESEEELRLLTR